MPTNNPRVTFALTDEQLSALDCYMTDNKIRNQSTAIRNLITKGIEEFEKVQAAKAPTAKRLSAESIQIAEDYESLNRQGKRVIQQAMDAAVVLFTTPPTPDDSAGSTSAPKQDMVSRLIAERDGHTGTGG